MCPVPRKAPSAIGAVVEPRLAVSKKSMVKTNSKVETKSKVETNSKLETKSKEVNKSSTKSKSVAATKSILKTESVMKSKLAAKASTVNAPKVVLAKSKAQQVDCWIDSAPSKGLIAVVVGSNYKLFHLKNGWEQPGRDNNWAETVGFELLARVLVAQGFTGTATVYCDSKIALNALEGVKCRVPSINECGTRLQVVRGLLPFTLEAIHVSGRKNVADGFSRGRTVEGFKEMGGVVAIPDALESFIHA